MCSMRPGSRPPGGSKGYCRHCDHRRRVARSLPSRTAAGPTRAASPRVIAFVDLPPGTRFLSQAVELNDGQVLTFFSPLMEKHSQLDPRRATTIGCTRRRRASGTKAVAGGSDNGPLSCCKRFLTVPWRVTMGMLTLIAGTVSYLQTHLLLGCTGGPAG